MKISRMLDRVRFGKEGSRRRERNEFFRQAVPKRSRKERKLAVAVPKVERARRVPNEHAVWHQARAQAKRQRRHRRDVLNGCRGGYGPVNQQRALEIAERKGWL